MDAWLVTAAIIRDATVSYCIKSFLFGGSGVDSSSLLLPFSRDGTVLEPSMGDMVLRRLPLDRPEAESLMDDIVLRKLAHQGQSV